MSSDIDAGSRSIEVLLGGYFGFGNLGDEAILEAAVEIFLSLGIKKEQICILSASVGEHRTRYGVDAVDRWSVKEIFKTLRVSKSLFLPGGGLFQDATSVRSCFYYWTLCKMARLCGAPVCALGQSVGPLRSKWAAEMARNAFRGMSAVTARDVRSAEILRSYGVDVSLMPDTTYALDLRPISIDRGGPVLINIRPTGTDNAVCREKVLKICKYLESKDKKMRFIAMSEEDLALCPEYMEALLVRTAGELADAADTASAAVGMRYHFAVLLSSLGIPVAVSSYDPKLSSFAEESGLIDLMCYNDYDMIDAIQNLLTNDNARYNTKCDGRSDERSLVIGSFERGIAETISPF